MRLNWIQLAQSSGTACEQHGNESSYTTYEPCIFKK